MHETDPGPLRWPDEAARYPGAEVRRFSAPGSNIALDFHGDPATAGLAVFSDGNHHMALEAVTRAFLAARPDVGDVFYTTTPPAILVDALKGDGLALGNLRISRKPDVFIGPADVVEGLFDTGLVSRHSPFAQSLGNVVLVRKGNPKGISSVSDLLGSDIVLACSNPVTEKASFSVYSSAVANWADAAGIGSQELIDKLSISGPGTVHSQRIHHREVPELLWTGRADAAVIYYHLALRYTRIFPDAFDFVDVGGILSDGDPGNHVTTRYHVGVVGDGGEWGSSFFDFIQEPEALGCYEHHGLIRAA